MICTQVKMFEYLSLRLIEYSEKLISTSLMTIYACQTPSSVLTIVFSALLTRLFRTNLYTDSDNIYHKNRYHICACLVFMMAR